jgi:hypothetical protein
VAPDDIPSSQLPHRNDSTAPPETSGPGEENTDRQRRSDGDIQFQKEQQIVARLQARWPLFS